MEEEKGICYLSRIPPRMRVIDLRNLFRNYGVDRIFLKPLNRKKKSKKRKRNYKDGYVEFKSVEKAQNAAMVFNGRPLLTKKRSKFHDEILCIKYQPELSWADLLEEKTKK